MARAADTSSAEPLEGSMRADVICVTGTVAKR
jgi:hypothetical protein